MAMAIVRKQVAGLDRALPMTPDQAQDAIEQGLPEHQRWDAHLSKNDQEKMAIALEVLGHIRNGKTLRSIADIMGFSHMTASRYRDLALASLAVPLVEEARKEQMEMVAKRIEVLTPRANAGDTQAERLLHNYLERWAKLTGADRPTEVKAPISSQIPAHLQSLLEQARADAQVIEGEVVEG